MIKIHTAMLFFLIFLLAPPAAAADTGQPRLISVTGNAEIRVVPDEVILTVGVETRDLVLETAKSRNDEIVTAALASARSHGVEKEHLKTDFLSLEPRYRYSGDRRQFEGYDVRRTVVVTLRDITRFEPLLSSLLESGVNYVHGVDFRTTELRKHRDEARALAIKAAKEKARALAAELEETVGQPRTISEGYNHWSSSYGWWGSGRWNNMAQNVVQHSGSAGSEVDGPTTPGRITVSASVSVTFELAD